MARRQADFGGPGNFPRSKSLRTRKVSVPCISATSRVENVDFIAVLLSSNQGYHRLQHDEHKGKWELLETYLPKNVDGLRYLRARRD